MSQTKGIEAAARAIHQMLGITSDAKAGLHPLRRCLGDRQVLDDSWRGWDLNPRPSGYEPDELPDCSTPLILTLAISNARCLPCRIGRVPFSTALGGSPRQGVRCRHGRHSSMSSSSSRSSRLIWSSSLPSSPALGLDGMSRPRIGPTAMLTADSCPLSTRSFAPWRRACRLSQSGRVARHQAGSSRASDRRPDNRSARLL